MYNILFSNETKFEVNLNEYLNNPYKFEDFTITILTWLEEAKITVIDEEFFFHKKKMLWIINIKR
jgi:hypothetical protein